LWAVSLPMVASAEVDPNALDPVARRVSRLASELHSPFCPGKTLLTCTSYQAVEVRREISALAEEGKKDAEIIKLLQAKYGDHFKKGRQLANPVQPWYTIIVPFLPFVLLGCLLIWVFRRWRRPAEEDDVATPAAPTAEDEARLARLRQRVQNDTD
jgi:cytochrome c-type biogenesis protein CcmH/NrfF